MNKAIINTHNQNIGAAEMAAFIASIDVSKSTIDSYKNKVQAFIKWTLEFNIAKPTSHTILDYKRFLIEGGKTPATVNAYLSAVRSFYAWAEREGFYPNIARSIKGQKSSQNHSHDAMTAEQARAVMTGAQTPREQAILAVLFSTGIRTIEAVRANIENLRIVDGQQLLYVHGKGRQSADEFVIIPEQVAKILQAYLATRGRVSGASALFTSESNRNSGGRLTTRTIRNIAKAAFFRAGITSRTITTHSTRHTAVTLALKAGATLQEAASMARHASITTTQIYAHNIERMTAGTTEKIAGAIF